jgi:uncharacterized protein (TIGR03067 family)
MTDSGTGNLNGEWEVVAFQMGGTSIDTNLGACIEIRDGLMCDRHARTTTWYRIETDDSHWPKRMTWTMVGIDVDGAVQRLPVSAPSAPGIYELEGDDLRFCWANPGLPYPEDYSSLHDAECRSYVCRRVN